MQPNGNNEFHAACKVREQKLNARISYLEDGLSQLQMREKFHLEENQNLIRLLAENNIAYTSNLTGNGPTNG